MHVESRYVVLKISDIPDALDIEETEQLQYLTDKIIEHRKINGKREIEGLFIEKHWPEYELLLKTLSSRVDKQGE